MTTLRGRRNLSESNRWKSLPPKLDPAVQHLVEYMRQLTDQARLTLKALEEGTSCSKSSWQRWLNGMGLPSCKAVEALGRLTQADQERLLVLWQLADQAWSKRGGARSAPDSLRPKPAASAPSISPRWPRYELGRVAFVVAVVVWLHVPNESPRSATSSPSTRPVPICQGRECSGKDPFAEKCGGDARTAAALPVGKAYIELRVSNRCDAVWARISSSTVGDRLHVVARDRRSEGTVVPNEEATKRYVYTKMIAPAHPSEAWACVEPHDRTQRCTRAGSNKEVPAPKPNRR